MAILKYLEIPHVQKWTGWRRKAVIIVAFPQEIVRAVYGVFVNAAVWWRSA